MPHQHKRQPLTSEETNLLISACETIKEKAIIFTLLDTGLRVAEFSSLTKSNIDWQDHRITVFGKGGENGKMSRRRVVPMTDRVQAVLEPYLAVNNRMLKPKQVREIVKGVANRAGISKKCSPHVLRHTFACNCIRKGISLPTLKEMLGHEHLETTFIYMNMEPANALREMREKW